ncbi:hypothetical protein OB236_09745 [Paenibacillus sp. WQ 127069]|uniref:Uncharacterized protein n=1 Tax=Paenibacillus baimaensis TaxID=2982185 RepID=A0ABT2UE51_9BACL|nr:hypothetical protein [Paenibacillus sp. WQ 127069]MCU6792411.1 hypothetical protein [Paenibacillus sp. WQ 127069]
MNNQSLMFTEIGKVSLIDIIRYFNSIGWKQVSHPNDKVIMFYGSSNDMGKPLEIAIPNKVDYQDYYSRIYDALKVLSVILNKDIKIILNEINLTSHDLFRARILNTGDFSNSIPLSYAATSINGLKDLFIYAACSEERSLPYFDRPLQVGILHADLCRFGHTFEGSFGITINSPIINDYVQLSMFEEDKAIPFERRVMERIVRSFDLIEKSVMKNDAEILINNFDIGLNSKMCESLLELSQSKTKNLGFDITWSPKFEVSEDIRKSKEWKLTEASYEVIEYAAYELSKIEPYQETIIGKIITLHSNKNPLSDEEFSRQAIVKYDFEGKIVNVKLDLDKEGYSIAYDAHGKGLPIEVVGTIFRKGNTWKMVDVVKISIWV